MLPLTAYRRELQQCAGLAFTFVKKAGAVITVDAGSGFVLAKTKHSDGSVSWSAPLFISVFSGGLNVWLMGGWVRGEGVVGVAAHQPSAEHKPISS